MSHHVRDAMLSLPGSVLPVALAAAEPVGTLATDDATLCDAHRAALVELITDSPRTYEIGGKPSSPSAFLGPERIRLSEPSSAAGGTA